jgi:hypothetical protein
MLVALLFTEMEKINPSGSMITAAGPPKLHARCPTPVLP